MDKLENILNQLYTNGSTMVYIYIAIGIIAIFLIVLVIISSIKDKKRNNDISVQESAKATQSADVKVSSTPLVAEVKEAQVTPTPIVSEKPVVSPIIETPVQASPVSPTPISAVKIEHPVQDEVANAYLEPRKNNDNPQVLPNINDTGRIYPRFTPITEQQEEIKPKFMEEDSLGGKSISELFKDDADDLKLNDIAVTPIPLRKTPDAMELPKTKAEVQEAEEDVSTNLFHLDDEPKKDEEKPVVLSNDELMKKLDSLRNSSSSSFIR